MNSSKNVGLYGKNKTIKLLEDSTADFTTSHLHNSEEHKYFSNMMSKSQTIRGKTTNPNLLSLRMSVHLKMLFKVCKEKPQNKRCDSPVY